MSGENIFNLYAQNQQQQQKAQQEKDASERNANPTFSGKYKKHLEEPPKPVYSTFFEKGKEYDGSNVRFFRQRHAVIGKNVAEDIHPDHYLRKGGGVRHVVPPIHEEKIYTKPPLDTTKPAFTWADSDDDEQKGGGDGNGDLDGWAGTYDMGDNEDGDNQDGLGKVAARGLNLDTGAQDGAATNAAKSGTKTATWSPAQCTKDFVKSNIVEMSTMVPKRRIDEPQHPTNRKDFGRNPAYLQRVKGEVEKEKSFVRSLDDQKEARKEEIYSKYVYQLPENQKKAILEKLQQKLKEKTAIFDTLPFSKDTVTMAKKKNDLERTIADLEEAIKKLNREAIFVYKDDPVNSQWTKAAALKQAQDYVSNN